MGNKKSFQSVATDDRFDFEAAVKEAYRQNPEIETTVFFVDIGKGQVAHPNRKTLKEILHFISDSDAGKQFLQPQMRECPRNKTSYCHFGGESSFVYIYTGADRLRFFSPRVGEAQEMAFIFDHEFDHAHIAAGGSDNRFLAENTADAYALIRHIQRFGTGMALAEEVVAFRARDTVFKPNGIFNFSCRALEHVLDTAKTLDYSKLTPAETSALVEQIAHEFTPDIPALKKLHDIFAPLHKNGSAADLAKISLESGDAEVLKWSATVLKALLSKNLAPIAGQEEINPDRTWNKRMKQIARCRADVTPGP